MKETEQKIAEVENEIMEIVADKPLNAEIHNLNVQIVKACLVKLEILFDIKNLENTK